MTAPKNEVIVSPGGGVRSAVIATRLEPAERAMIDQIAARTGKRPTQIVRAWIREGIARSKPPAA